MEWVLVLVVLPMAIGVPVGLGLAMVPFVRFGSRRRRRN